MGWWGIEIHGGDIAADASCFILERAGIKKIRYSHFGPPKLTIQDKKLFQRELLNVMGSVLQRGHTADCAVYLQVLADTVMENKLPMPKALRSAVKWANDFLQGEDADRFQCNKERRQVIKEFARKVRAYRSIDRSL